MGARPFAPENRPSTEAIRSDPGYARATLAC